MQRDTLSNHHAPWRINDLNNRGSLSPEIYESKALDLIRSYGPKRLILSACDYKFFENYCQNLIDYERSSCELIYVLGVFSGKKESKHIAEKLYKFRANNNLKKFIPFVYGNTNLEWILSQQNSTEIEWDYKINYIRSSRYNLVKKVWKSLGIRLKDKCSLREESTYILDFDNVIKSDINHIIKKEYPNQSLILSWDSEQSPSPDFTKTLLSSSINESTIDPKNTQTKDITITVHHPYKVVKAGFTAITPSITGHVFLYLFESYSIGDNDSCFFMRLFSFYFCDQVAILLAIRDIYAHKKYKQTVSWMDVNKSNIVNLDSEIARYIWYPKGDSLKTH